MTVMADAAGGEEVHCQWFWCGTPRNRLYASDALESAYDAAKATPGQDVATDAWVKATDECRRQLAAALAENPVGTSWDEMLRSARALRDDLAGYLKRAEKAENDREFERSVHSAAVVDQRKSALALVGDSACSLKDAIVRVRSALGAREDETADIAALRGVAEIKELHRRLSEAVAQRDAAGEALRRANQQDQVWTGAELEILKTREILGAISTETLAQAAERVIQAAGRAADHRAENLRHALQTAMGFAEGPRETWDDLLQITMRWCAEVREARKQTGTGDYANVIRTARYILDANENESLNQAATRVGKQAKQATDQVGVLRSKLAAIRDAINGLD